MLYFISHISDNRNDLVMDININLIRPHFKGVLSSPCLRFTSPLLLWEEPLFQNVKIFFPVWLGPELSVLMQLGQRSVAFAGYIRYVKVLENKRYATFRNDFGFNVSLTVKLSYNPTRFTEGKIDIASLSHFTKH